MKEIIVTKDLTKSFGKLVAVNRVNITVEQGELRSIIGPNGAGKTTLFNLLTGSLYPDTGKVFFDGEDITGLQIHKIIQKGISRSFQIPSIFPKLSVFENVRIAVQAIGKDTYNFIKTKESLKNVKEEACNILEQVGLLSKGKLVADNLSHGEKRMLEIGIALATNPKLLLLDEPTSGLTDWDTEKIVQMIKRLSKNITTVFIEHDVNIVLDISDKITVMHQGEILAEGSPTEIKGNEKVQEAYLGGIE